MATFIKTSSKSRTGYELHITDENGHTRVELINSYDPNRPTSLQLPENPANWKYFSTKKLEAIPEEGLELTYKAPRVLGPRLPGSGMTQKITDFATPEELEVYNNLLEKWKARREEAKTKANDPLEKAKRQYERAQAKYEALMAELMAEPKTEE